MLRLSRIYPVILFFITLTGFAQMPIFKRYYIADIPGLGWLAQFFVTHSLHYIFAGILIGISVFAGMDYFLNPRPGTRITPAGYARITALLGLVATGVLMVVKNLSGVYFPHAVIIGLDLLHLLFCMMLLGVSAWALKTKKGWIH